MLGVYVGQNLSEDGRQWLLGSSAVLHSLVATSEPGCTDRNEHEDDFFAQSGIAQPYVAQPYVADESNGMTCTVFLLTNPADLCFTD